MPSTGYASATGPSSTISSLTDVIRETNNKIDAGLAKIDQHIDQLEEDIDYFNRSLDQQHGLIDTVENKANANLTMNIEQDKKIKALEDAVEFLKNYTNYLEGRIMSLEDKLSGKEVCKTTNSY